MMCSLCQGAARAWMSARGAELGDEMAPGGMCPPQHTVLQGPKARAELGWSWGSLTVPDTASDEPGPGRWGPGRSFGGQGEGAWIVQAVQGEQQCLGEEKVQGGWTR